MRRALQLATLLEPLLRRSTFLTQIVDDLGLRPLQQEEPHDLYEVIEKGPSEDHTPTPSPPRVTTVETG